MRVGMRRAYALFGRQCSRLIYPNLGTGALLTGAASSARYLR